MGARVRDLRLQQPATRQQRIHSRHDRRLLRQRRERDDETIHLVFWQSFSTRTRLRSFNSPLKVGRQNHRVQKLSKRPEHRANNGDVLIDICLFDFIRNDGASTN